jgi:hypothetical protein
MQNARDTIREEERMERKRKGKSPGPVAARRRTASKRGHGADGAAGKGEPLTAPRVIEFPKRPAADDVISDRIIFDVGGDRFAIKWSAEIEQLPPAGPVVVEQKGRSNLGRSPRLRRLSHKSWAVRQTGR